MSEIYTTKSFSEQEFSDDLQIISSHYTNASRKLRDYEEKKRGKGQHDIFINGQLGDMERGLTFFKHRKFSDSQAKFTYVKQKLESLLSAIVRGVDKL